LVNIIVNGKNISGSNGKPLVEVLKENGFPITNLCYLDGLDPYAGCRTCVVEIEGAKPTPLQLSCTTVISEGMVVNTESNQAKEIRQSVMSFITTNHPDRCLTCHRRVHCQPGEICLRDDVITHRCLTCAKNYRCELQTATELVDLGDWQEPWVGEERSYYETVPPKPDRANPFLEFDPQMCILCTRCVRACADIRHTGAISLSGKGFDTKISFGAGGPIQESNCDYCGACIDVCPTATLMEKPNKWNGLASDWTNSVCNGCSMNCTISYGIANKGEPVIVRPVTINKTSQEQICVRGRFGYSEINLKDRLQTPFVKINGNLRPINIEDAKLDVANYLKDVISKSGSESIGILASPFSTNEDAAFLHYFAKDIIQTNNLDYIDGENYRAVVETWESISGFRKLPSDTQNIKNAKLIFAIGPDLEDSHQIAALRIKDAVTNNNAELIVISPKWNELVPFAKNWIQTKPGDEAIILEEISAHIKNNNQEDFTSQLTYLNNNDIKNIISNSSHFQDEIDKKPEIFNQIAIIYAHPNYYIDDTKNILINQAISVAKLASLLVKEQASEVIYYLPNEANVVGLDDMQIKPIGTGQNFYQMLNSIMNGKIKCLIIHADNPLIRAADQVLVKNALTKLDKLILIDSALSTLSDYAHFIFPDLPFYLKSGTTTNSSSYIFKHNFNQAELFTTINKDNQLQIIFNDIAKLISSDKKTVDYSNEKFITNLNKNYSKYPNFMSGNYRSIDKNNSKYSLMPIKRDKKNTLSKIQGIRVLAGKTLFTSRELTSMGAPNADLMGREQKGVINPIDAKELGLNGLTDSKVIISNNDKALTINVDISDRIAPGTIFIPQYFQNGQILEFLNQSKNKNNFVEIKT
jgi:predicted molibdopterin-dependent oxidoreductase YjgC